MLVYPLSEKEKLKSFNTRATSVWLYTERELRDSQPRIAEAQDFLKKTYVR